MSGLAEPTHQWAKEIRGPDVSEANEAGIFKAEPLEPFVIHGQKMKKIRILNRCFENFIARKFVVPFIWAKTGGMVASGPFEGMKYVKDSVGSRLLPKLLGTYELELHPTIEKVCRESFDTIID